MDIVSSNDDPRKLTCCTCKGEYPATTDFFHKQPKNIGRYGFASECKDCKRESAAARRKTPEGREAMNRRAAIFRANHREQINERRRERYYANTEKENETSRQYGISHRKERSNQRRVYRQSHPGSRKGENANRRAQKHSVLGTHTIQQVKTQYERQKGKCYYCSKRVKWGDHHVDHTFPISRVAGTDIPANDISYLVIACAFCNMSKNNRYPHEWPEGNRLL